MRDSKVIYTYIDKRENLHMSSSRLQDLTFTGADLTTSLISDLWSLITGISPNPDSSFSGFSAEDCKAHFALIFFWCGDVIMTLTFKSVTVNDITYRSTSQQGVECLS